MGPVVVFDLRGELAHFRRPDTFATHASYPFIPRTALRGLIGAVLGEEYRTEGDVLPAEARCGLRLLSPVRTVAQELSLHGKRWLGGGGDESFHRPTSIELVVQPRYRVFYAGPRAEELAARLERRQSVFHTYLGSAFCLTFPEWVGSRSALAPAGRDRLDCVTVVPSSAVGRLVMRDGTHVARVGGIMREHIGDRRFRGTMAVLYERSGGLVSFTPADPLPPDQLFLDVEGEGTVCLW
jgi:CRISPR-associated protein Cas5h